VILTLGAGLMVKEDPNAACEILIATIGCNVALGHRRRRILRDGPDFRACAHGAPRPGVAALSAVDRARRPVRRVRQLRYAGSSTQAASSM
jgi:hypothetical protein